MDDISSGNATLPEPHATLDIRTRVCPMTFVRTRLALDQLQPGQVLKVRLRGEEPIRSVPSAAAGLGHAVLSLTLDMDGDTDGDATLLLRRA